MEPREPADSAAAPRPPRRPSRAKGCAFMMFGLAGLLGCLLYFATRFTREQYRKRFEEWRNSGFVIFDGHGTGVRTFDVTNRLSGKSAFVAADTVILRDGAGGDVDLLLVRTAVVHGTVSGVLRFSGGDLTLAPDAVVASGLMANASAIACAGRILGPTNAYFRTWNGERQGDILRRNRRQAPRE